MEGVAEASVSEYSSLPNRERGFIDRFIWDMDLLARAMARTGKNNCRLVAVVADSSIRGGAVSNSKILTLCAQRAGFVLEDCTSRDLPSNARYLPPPQSVSGSLATRMKQEQVITLKLRK
jgi:hypothetical protein